MTREGSGNFWSRGGNRRSPALAWLVVVGATLYGGYWRSVNLGPGSLFLDDAWVAVLSRAPTLQDFLRFGSSSPPLFNVCVTLGIWLLPGAELSAQLFGFVCSTLAIAATGVAAYVVSRRAWAGAVASVIVTCHPVAIEFTARVKQYSSDMLVVAVYIIAFCVLCDRPTVRRLWACTLAAGACSLLSTVSLFVLATFFPCAILGRVRRDLPLPHVAGACAVLAGTIVLVFFGVIRPGVNDALRAYWAPHYLPVSSAGAFWQSLQGVLADWVAISLHGVDAGQRQGWVLIIGTAAIALGALNLLLMPGRRGLVVATLGFLLGLMVASACRRFPLGTGRVDLFVVPLIAVFVGTGVTFVAQVRSRAFRWCWVLAVAAFVLVKLPVRSVPPYPLQISSPLIGLLIQEKTATDVVLVNVHGTFALGYYAPWRPRFVANASLGTQFHVVPDIAGVEVIGEKPQDAQEAVTRALAARPARIFLLLVHAPETLRAKVEEALVASNWTLQRHERQPGADLLMFAPR